VKIDLLERMDKHMMGQVGPKKCWVINIAMHICVI
jgi:hypothetical protein